MLIGELTVYRILVEMIVLLLKGMHGHSSIRREEHPLLRLAVKVGLGTAKLEHGYRRIKLVPLQDPAFIQRLHWVCSPLPPLRVSRIRPLSTVGRRIIPSPPILPRPMTPRKSSILREQSTVIHIPIGSLATAKPSITQLFHG